MNSAPENITVLPTNTERPVSTAADDIQIQNPKIDNGLNPRRNGKIAHLPKDQRDIINHMLDDGATYETISSKFAEQGISLNLANIHAWFHGGYQDYLQACERRQQIRDTQDRLLDMARNSDAPALSFVGLQLAITQLAQQLYEITPGSHKQSFQTDSNQYLRMLNTLARLSKALLSLQQYQEEAAKAQAAQLEKKDIERDLADGEFELLVNQMDRVFRMPRPTPSSSPSPTAPPSPSSQPTETKPSKRQKPKVNNAPQVPLDTGNGSAEPALKMPAQETKPTQDSAPAAQSDFKVQSSEFTAQPSPSSSATEATPPNPPAHAPIENQNSKIKNLAEGRGEGNSLGNSSAATTQIENQNSKSENSDQMPDACALCGNHPISFAIRPLPAECHICPICPVPRETNAPPLKPENLTA